MNPSTTEPGTTEPGTTEPGTTEDGSTGPGTSNPVLWLHHARPRSRWYELESVERQRFSEGWLRAAETSRAAGAEDLGTYRVRGQSDWSTVQVWRFPDADAVLRHWEGQVEAGYATWFAFSNALGTDAAASLVDDSPEDAAP